MSLNSFEPFLSARNSLEFFRIASLTKRKTSKYCIYKLKENQESQELEYIGVMDNLFGENDELIIARRDRKIVLFKNFTQNTDNFKEAFLRIMLFVILFFVASAVFAVFCVMNSFMVIDIAFFVVFFVGFVASLINFLKINKQIKILSQANKAELQNFLKSH